VPPSPISRCRACGADLQEPRQRCTACDQEYRAAADHPRLARLATLRAEGRDPAHGGEAGRSRGSKNASHIDKAATWEQDNPRPDPEGFRRGILPGLRHCSPQAMADATGLSRPYCSLILAGQRVPHPRHWETLAGLGEQAQ
jgi:hypothetical protein